MYNSKGFTDVVTRKECVRGPNFQVADLNRNLTQFRLSETHFQPSQTARNGSLDMRQPEMVRSNQKCSDRLEIQVLIKKFSSKLPSLKLITEISIGKLMCCNILV